MSGGREQFDCKQSYRNSFVEQHQRKRLASRSSRAGSAGQKNCRDGKVCFANLCRDEVLTAFVQFRLSNILDPCLVKITRPCFGTACVCDE